MIVLKTHLVPEQIPQIRLVDYVVKIFFEYPSRSAVKKAIKRGEILLDEQKTNQAEFIRPNQIISIVELQRSIPKVYELNLEVIYEDEHLAVIQKPAGISVSGNKYKTIVNALPFNLRKTAEKNALHTPLPAHRLDYSTSGLLLIAKTRFVLARLGYQFENREIAKNYRAIVIGELPEKGIIDDPVDGQEAITRYYRLNTARSLKVDHISLLDLFPETGRTHQLRKHLAGIGHPIVGDTRYCNDYPLLRGKGLFLAAIGLSFKHPVNQKELQLTIATPHKFESLFDREDRRWKKYHNT